MQTDKWGMTMHDDHGPRRRSLLGSVWAAPVVMAAATAPAASASAGDSGYRIQFAGLNANPDFAYSPAEVRIFPRSEDISPQGTLARGITVITSQTQPDTYPVTWSDYEHQVVIGAGITVSPPTMSAGDKTIVFPAGYPVVGGSVAASLQFSAVLSNRGRITAYVEDKQTVGSLDGLRDSDWYGTAWFEQSDGISFDRIAFAHDLTNVPTAVPIPAGSRFRADWTRAEWRGTTTAPFDFVDPTIDGVPLADDAILIEPRVYNSGGRGSEDEHFHTFRLKDALPIGSVLRIDLALKPEVDAAFGTLAVSGVNALAPRAFPPIRTPTSVIFGDEVPR